MEKSKQNICVLHAHDRIPDSQTTLPQGSGVPSFNQIMAPCSSEPCVDNHHSGDHCPGFMSGQPHYLLVNIASVTAIWIVCYWEIISMFQMLWEPEVISQIIKSIKSFHFSLNDWSESGLFGQNYHDCIIPLLLWSYIKSNLLIHIHGSDFQH